jgi:hypothetical protein
MGSEARRITIHQQCVLCTDGCNAEVERRCHLACEELAGSHRAQHRDDRDAAVFKLFQQSADGYRSANPTGQSYSRRQRVCRRARAWECTVYQLRNGTELGRQTASVKPVHQSSWSCSRLHCTHRLCRTPERVSFEHACHTLSDWKSGLRASSPENSRMHNDLIWLLV